MPQMGCEESQWPPEEQCCHWRCADRGHQCATALFQGLSRDLDEWGSEACGSEACGAASETLGPPLAGTAVAAETLSPPVFKTVGVFDEPAEKQKSTPAPAPPCCHDVFVQDSLEPIQSICENLEGLCGCGGARKGGTGDWCGGLRGLGGGISARRTRNGGRIGGRKQRAARMGRNNALAVRNPEADEVLDWEEDLAANERTTTTNIPNPECEWEVIEETRSA